MDIRNLLTGMSANQRIFGNAAGSDFEWGFGTKVVAYTRDMTLASGDISYTGAGFKPRSIIALSKYIAGLYIGFGDITNSAWQVGLYGTNLATTDYNATYLVSLVEDAAVTKDQLARLKSMDSDGCTLTWTKFGVPAAGTGYFILIYIR